MKKNLHISLWFLLTVFSILACHPSDQNQSFQQAKGAEDLSGNQSCDIVICLPGAGYTYKNCYIRNENIPDKEMNAVDLITGENDQNFFNDPVLNKKRDGVDLIVNKHGGTGIVLIRPDFEFTKFSGKKLAKSHTISVSQKTDG